MHFPSKLCPFIFICPNTYAHSFSVLWPLFAVLTFSFLSSLQICIQVHVLAVVKVSCMIIVQETPFTTLKLCYVKLHSTTTNRTHTHTHTHTPTHTHTHTHETRLIKHINMHNSFSCLFGLGSFKETFEHFSMMGLTY